MYQDEKEERKQFAEAEAKIEYYQKQLVQQLAGYRVQMPERWISRQLRFWTSGKWWRSVTN